MNMLKRLLQEEEGQGFTEYGLILGLVVILIAGAFAVFNDEITTLFQKVANKIQATSNNITT